MRQRSAIALVVSLAPALAAADGLWDPGLLDGRWRSDFDDPLSGTAARPLAYDASCPFPQTPFAICARNMLPVPGMPTGVLPRVYSRSNWTSSFSGSSDWFWLVSANVEPTLDTNCNSGPPNQSEPIARPFESVFGVSVQPADAIGQPYRNEVVLAVDLAHRPRQLESRPQCQAREFIPYLSFGVDSQRGGGNQTLAWLNDDDGGSPVLRFNHRLVDSNAEFFADGEAVPATPRGQYAGMFVEAQWAGRKRWVWINLINAFALPSSTTMMPWNWALRDSLFHPGAEIVFTSGPALQAECGSTGLQLPSTSPAGFAHRLPVPVSVDLQRLFECVGDHFSTPFATQPGPIAITGLQFFVEVGIRDRDGRSGFSTVDYDSRLGIAFDSIDIAASDTPTGSDAGYLVQLGADLLGRPWSAFERTHWLQRIATVGRTDATAELLRSLPVRRGIVAAARLSLIGFGWRVDRPAFSAIAGLLNGGGSDAEAAATLAADPAFIRAISGMDDAGFVRTLFRRALGVELARHPDATAIAAAVGDVAYWTEALRSGRARPADLLLALHRLADARGLLDREAEVVTLYHAFFGFTPDEGGVGYWRTAPTMPHRLIELLYYTGEYRSRFAD